MFMGGLPFDPIAEAARNWDDRGWGAADAMQAVTSISRAHQIINARINEALAEFDLNLSRFEVLALLYMSRQRELPMGKIGERLQVHPASVTNTVDRLEAAGWVERQQHPSDRRTTLAVLTSSGESLIEKAAQVMASVDYGAGGLTKAALNRLTSDLTALRQDAGDF